MCWSNDKPFNSAAAGQMVAEHAQWLEDQKPLSIKLVEARELYTKAKKKHDDALAICESSRSMLADCEQKLADLSRAQGDPTNGK